MNDVIKKSIEEAFECIYDRANTSHDILLIVQGAISGYSLYGKYRRLFVKKDAHGYGVIIRRRHSTIEVMGISSYYIIHNNHIRCTVEDHWIKDINRNVAEDSLRLILEIYKKRISYINVSNKIKCEAIESLVACVEDSVRRHYERIIKRTHA